ncbi:LysR family transcriptional regulator [Enterococcus faecalis]|nr:LysR family transcriptional regulator [Enterococcus faecalis]
MKMEIRKLQYFLTVAREENITRAAEILFISQPALSRQIQQLEEELGVQLVIRGKRKIILTEVGMLLRNRAEEILSLIEKTENECKAFDSKINGQIFVGIPESNAGKQLIELLNSFRSEYPDATYDIYTGTGDDIQDRMEKGLVDIGVLMAPANIEKYHSIELDQQERWGILLPVSSPLSQKSTIQPEDLENVPLLISKRYRGSKELSRWFSVEMDELNVVATFNLTTNAAIMVKNGMGFATVVGGSFLGEAENTICFRPFFPPIYSKSVLAWKKNQMLNPTVKKFLEHSSLLLSESKL